MRTPVRDADLRSFGLVVGGVLTAISVWPIVRAGQPPHLWAAIPAAALIIAAIVAPRSLRHVHRTWMAFAEILAWINARIILGMMFYVVITPMACIMRLMGRDPMRRRFDVASDSYRTLRKARPATHMWRQF